MLLLPYHTLPIYQNAEEALRLNAIIEEECSPVANGMLRRFGIPHGMPLEYLPIFEETLKLPCWTWLRQYYASHAYKGTPLLPLGGHAAIRRYHPHMTPLYGPSYRKLREDLIERITYDAYNRLMDVATAPEFFVEQVERYNMIFEDVVTLWGGPIWYTAIDTHNGTRMQPTISRQDLMTYARLGLNAAEVSATFGVDDSYLNHVLHDKDATTLVACIRLLSVPYAHHPTIYWDGMGARKKHQLVQPSLDQLAYIRGQMYPYVEEFTIDGVTFPAGRRRSIMEILTDQKFIDALNNMEIAPVPVARIMGMNLRHAMILVLPVLNMLTQRFTRSKKLNEWYNQVKDLPYEQWREALPELTNIQYRNLTVGAYYRPLTVGLPAVLNNYLAYQFTDIPKSGRGFRFTYAKINKIYREWKFFKKKDKRK